MRALLLAVLLGACAGAGADDDTAVLGDDDDDDQVVACPLALEATGATARSVVAGEDLELGVRLTDPCTGARANEDIDFGFAGDDLGAELSADAVRTDGDGRAYVVLTAGEDSGDLVVLASHSPDVEPVEFAIAVTVPDCDDHCDNHARDCGEAGVDCGGACEACADPCEGHCANGDTDCGESGVDCGGACTDCADPCAGHCSNGDADCGESGVDCGGACTDCADPCAGHCSNGDTDCGESGVDCGGACTDCGDPCAGHCSNGDTDCGETGVDCGGSCAACGDACAGHCSNGDTDCGETGLDCGGSCAACGDACTGHCSNGETDCGETGVDCGGSCAACADPCAGHCSNGDTDCGEAGEDCGGSCAACADPCAGHCSNGVSDCDEAEIDCGADCVACGDFDDAEVVSASMPATMGTLTTASVNVTMRNTGTSVWWAAGDDGYKLGYVGDTGNAFLPPGHSPRLYLPAGTSVAPGDTVTFTVSLRSPAAPGSYDAELQMLLEGVQWFGEIAHATIVVSDGGSSGCTFPQGVPDEDFIGTGDDVDAGVAQAVNEVMVALSGCSAGSDCPLEDTYPTAQSWFDAVNEGLRAEGYCAGQHEEGHTDEIAVSDTGCTGKWYGYHIFNYGGAKVVWNPGAQRGYWTIDPSWCAGR